jgi:short-subunit dehydrogenase
MRMEHWHLILITRSSERFNEYKNILEKNGIKTIQNDIPAYKSKDDYVLRLFVKNKDIFAAKKLFEDIP